METLQKYIFIIAIGLYLIWLCIYFLIDRALRRAIGKRYGVTIKLEVSSSTLAIGWIVVDASGQWVKNPPHRALTQWLGFWLFWIVNLTMAAILVGGTFWILRP